MRVIPLLRLLLLRGHLHLHLWLHLLHLLWLHLHLLHLLHLLRLLRLHLLRLNLYSSSTSCCCRSGHRAERKGSGGAISASAEADGS